MTEENKKVFIRMANSVGMPIDITAANILLDFIKLIDEKGNTCTLKDVDDVVLKYIPPKEVNKQKTLNDEQQ